MRSAGSRKFGKFILKNVKEWRNNEAMRRAGDVEKGIKRTGGKNN
jgi:hypothetical protein